MRADEFISEARDKGSHVGPLGARRQQATVGLNKFRDPKYSDRVYELNRVMMAAATTDGTSDALVDAESWAGRNDIAAPYTKIEQEMLKKAYKAVGSVYQDMNNGDLDSEELKSTNTQSPVRGFTGY